VFDRKCDGVRCARLPRRCRFTRGSWTLRGDGHRALRSQGHVGSRVIAVWGRDRHMACGERGGMQWAKRPGLRAAITSPRAPLALITSTRNLPALEDRARRCSRSRRTALPARGESAVRTVPARNASPPGGATAATWNRAAKSTAGPRTRTICRRMMCSCGAVADCRAGSRRRVGCELGTLPSRQ